MDVIVGEDIRIRNYTKPAEEIFKEKLVFENPDYIKKAQMGKWTGSTPREISLIQRQGADLIIPFGMLPIVFKHKEMFDGIYNTFQMSTEHFRYMSNIIPYDYQEKAIQEALKARQGVIVAPCGSGKTQIGLEVAARLGMRTLWLTHTADLLNQSKERAMAYFGLSGKDYGTITGGKVDMGKVLTFATVQTLSKIDLEKIKDYFDVVIVDECHHVVGSPTRVMMFYKVISSLKARYKYGLTATPKRADGLTGCMYALLGDKICEIGQEAVESKTCPVKVKIKKTAYIPNMNEILLPDGTISFPRFLDDITRSKERNELIVSDAENCEGSCLILTDRVYHMELLKTKLEARGVKCLSLSAATSKKAKEERKTALMALNTKCVKVVIATYALAKEGLDVPTLDNLIFATPQKNDITVTQSAGRVSRKAEGKEFGTIYDYSDSFNMLKSWQAKRNRIYKRLGFEIIEI